MATPNLEAPELASNQAQPDVTHNEALDWFDYAVSGQGQFDATADQDYDLELEEASGRMPFIYMWLQLLDTGGALTQSRKILLPNGNVRRMILDNQTAFTLDAQCKSGGALVSISPGTKVEVLSTGSDVQEIAFGTPEPIRGYGGVNRTTPTALSDITATPQVVDMEAGAVASPVNVTQDVANDGLSVAVAGVWRFEYSATLQFTSLGSGRTIEMQLWNDTTSTGTASAPWFVGRDQEGANISGSFMVDVSASVGDTLQLRLLSSADTFAGVTLQSAKLIAELVDAA